MVKCLISTFMKLDSNKIKKLSFEDATPDCTECSICYLNSIISNSDFKLESMGLQRVGRN